MKTAVVLFNLGGPDSPEAVRPFLVNLFSDPAIIGVPQPFRWLLARLIAGRRALVAREIYAQLGGGSPIRANTEAQAESLAAVLGDGFRCFVVMRHWHPRARDVVREIRNWQPDRVVLLPLYPQYSTTTTRSSVREFQHFWKSAVETVCCYPVETGFISAQADLIRPVLVEAGRYGPPRLLLSAHGLPEKIIKQGDPYQWQCEQTARAIVAKLEIASLDWRNTYQSRVGPLTWIGPSTEEAIIQAGRDRVPVVVVPISFVSEHAETLVELDREYRDLADRENVPFYGRVPVVGTHPAFIAGLADRVRSVVSKKRICPDTLSACPCRR